MWVFTPYGFFSAVEDRDDSERVLVRARVREHLAALISLHKAIIKRQLFVSDIVETPSADYPFRLYVPKGLWAKLTAAMALEIDYDNFKSACPAGDYHDALISVWYAMRRMQSKVEGSDF